MAAFSFFLTHPNRPSPKPFFLFRFEYLLVPQPQKVSRSRSDRRTDRQTNKSTARSTTDKSVYGLYYDRQKASLLNFIHEPSVSDVLYIYI